ncbi:hypothetical protein [Salinicola tamaricis]|uniref:hypothetical protein n=1 Tax=Salinicola tamaricis TaxID=1771309 RepID=UPI00101ADEB9|nr:hypothetical protein [Salinicola tamaricis]
MNRVQQKILEAVGLLSSNRQHFSSFSKEHVFDVRTPAEKAKTPGFVGAQENGCLVLAESWFRERGLYLSWGSLGAIFFAGMFVFIFFRLGVHNGLFNAPAILSMVFAFIILSLGGYPLFFAARSELKLQGLQYCVFSSSSKEVFLLVRLIFSREAAAGTNARFVLPILLAVSRVIITSSRATCLVRMVASKTVSRSMTIIT